MEERFIRTAAVLGDDSIEKLKKSRVAVFGIGGVGGYIAEALARGGVGTIDLIDRDEVSLSNINRQIVALNSTVGKAKVEVMKSRILDIDPNITVNTHKMFFMPENADEIDLSSYHYIADAIDTITAKIELICRSKALDIPIISAMGAGNKLDPTAFLVSDIYKTSVCPLAKVMRRELKSRGIKDLKVVYSKEEPTKPIGKINDKSGKTTAGSLPFVPPVMGLIMAGEIIKDLIK